MRMTKMNWLDQLKRGKFVVVRPIKSSIYRHSIGNSYIGQVVTIGTMFGTPSLVLRVLCLTGELFCDQEGNRPDDDRPASKWAALSGPDDVYVRVDIEVDDFSQIDPVSGAFNFESNHWNCYRMDGTRREEVLEVRFFNDLSDLTGAESSIPTSVIQQELARIT